MFRVFHALLFVLIASAITAPALTMSAAAAQNNSTSGDGCARDVVRHCRAVMNDGDMVVLACLKQNRAKLTKVCEKVLTDHGQ